MTQIKPNKQTDFYDLRVYVYDLVSTWTVLSIIRENENSEIIHILKDVCYNQLLIMLYELANKKSWTIGFPVEGESLTKESAKYERIFSKLKSSNEWFTGKNRLHARNCVLSHRQSSLRIQYGTQAYGYSGKREWKKITIGVAACLGMIKLIEKKDKSNNFKWKEIRTQIIADKMEEHNTEVPRLGIVDIPLRIKIMMLNFKVDEQ